MKEMAKVYGYDISGPATTAKEAVQWLYFGYLAAIKTQNGAAMSVGRISTFLDIYIERDLKEGTLTEKEAQELIDHMTMKFRMVKFARIPSTTSCSPVTLYGLHWKLVVSAWMAVTWLLKNDYRFLHTLRTWDPARAEPDSSVLQRFLKTSRSMRLRFPLTHLPSSMRMMML